MKTKFLIILTFFICLHSFGQKNDLIKLNLKGNVKSILEIFYHINIKEGKNQDTIIDFSYFNYFNKQGNKTNDIKYDAVGKVDKKYLYIYDSLGLRIAQNQYTSDGNLFREMTYKYDEKGNLTEDYSYTSEGKLEKKYTYQYDAKGYITEDQSFDADQKFLKKYTYSYNASGYIIENNRYSSDGILDKKILYNYDDKGNVIEEIQTAKLGKKITYYYEYKYDNQNNWIKKYSFNGKNIISITTREIEYY